MNVHVCGLLGFWMGRLADNFYHLPLDVIFGSGLWIVFKCIKNVRGLVILVWISCGFAVYCCCMLF